MSNFDKYRIWRAKVLAECDRTQKLATEASNQAGECLDKCEKTLDMRGTPIQKWRDLQREIEEICFERLKKIKTIGLKRLEEEERAKDREDIEERYDIAMAKANDLLGMSDQLEKAKAATNGVVKLCKRPKEWHY